MEIAQNQRLCVGCGVEIAVISYETVGQWRDVYANCPNCGKLMETKSGQTRYIQVDEQY